MPLFSILLPTNRNFDQTLPSFISCITGSFLDFEILLGIQNRDFLANYQRSIDFSSFSLKNKVKLIDTSAAKSLPGNLNMLILHSNSKFLVRHDDDDFMHPSRLQSLSDNIDLLNSSLFVGQSYKVFSDNSRFCSSRIDPCLDDISNRIKLLTQPCYAHPSLTINVDRLSFKYDESFDFAQDYKLYVDNFECGLFSGLPSMSTYYHSPNVSSKYYSQKRLRQLHFHDLCMYSLWSRLIPSDNITLDQITDFRRSFISADDFLNDSENMRTPSISIDQHKTHYNKLLLQLKKSKKSSNNGL